MNSMREVRIEKVVLNIGVGEGGDRLANAERILKEITGRNPIRTLAKKTVREWNIKRGAPIGCKVTLRGKIAEEVLDRLLYAVDRRIKASSFDDKGNFSFGIKEHIDIPGCKYNPEVGIFGLDVCVSLCRPGYRIRDRKRLARAIPKSHRVTKEEAIEFISKKFNVKVVD
ncbi:MAG: 50S ribosomal protein L5 [Candidatus Hadarchaeales archaeon]